MTEPTTPAPQTETETDEAEPSTLRTFLVIGGIALGIVVVLLAVAVFGLGQTSLLPFNYQGFDGK